jgi:non-ribosomal peptide synthase protein (TIGR01720 family)
LRAQLSEKLPQYMVPAVIVELDELPLTPSGKLDRNALPEPELNEREHEYAGPRTRVEEVLATIFAEVLRLEQVGIHDNFFALGGDSILSIHIGFRARQAGLYFTTQQLFQHQTIAELAPFVETASATESEQELLTGDFPLTPIQQRFFDQDLADAHHYNQSILLEVGEKIDAVLLQEAFSHLLDHHAALRLRFRKEESVWTQEIAPHDGFTVSEVDLSKLSDAELRPSIEATLADQQASLDLFAGPLLRATVFNCPPHQPDRLSIICHHLVIDGVSWRILLEDLETAYRQLRRQQPVQLPGTTTSFKRWAQSLFDYAQSPELLAEQDYWVTESLDITPLLPLDFSDGENVESSTETVMVALDAEETDALLHEVQSTLRAHINDILLTSLAHAFSQWTGERSLLVDLEGHGREPLIPNLDLSRTVGWFTNIFPVVLDLGEQREAVAELRSVKEQLRRVPKHGTGYGVLRYLTKENTEKQLLEFIQPQVLFNYFGQIDLVLSESSLFRSATEYPGPLRSPRGRRAYLLEVEASVIEGRLQSKWIYSREVHKRSTVEYLAEDFLAALRSLIASLHTQSSNYTPSDFPRMTIDQDELDELLAQVDLSLEDAQ